MYGVPVLSPTGPSLRLQIFFKTFDMYWQCSNLQLQLLLLRLDIRGARALSHRAITQAANIPYKICSVQICFSTKRKHWHSSSLKLQTFFKTNILIYWQWMFETTPFQKENIVHNYYLSKRGRTTWTRWQRESQGLESSKRLLPSLPSWTGGTRTSPSWVGFE